MSLELDLLSKLRDYLTFMALIISSQMETTAGLREVWWSIPTPGLRVPAEKTEAWVSFVV